MRVDTSNTTTPPPPIVEGASRTTPESDRARGTITEQTGVPRPRRNHDDAAIDFATAGRSVEVADHYPADEPVGDAPEQRDRS